MKALIWLLLATVAVTPLVAETITVRETIRGKTTVETKTRKIDVKDGLTWITEMGSDSERTAAYDDEGRLQNVSVTGKHGTWHLSNTLGLISGSGSVGPKPVAGSVQVGTRIWGSSFDAPLRWWFRHPEVASLKFLMIDPTNISKPTEMELRLEGRETLNGKPALRFHLGLTGAMALLWGATVWVDPATGNQVQYKGNRGPGTPDRLIQVEG